MRHPEQSIAVVTLSLSKGEGPLPSTATNLLQCGTMFLAESSPSARSDVQLLLAHTTGRSREWIAARPEAVISEEETQTFLAYCKRRRLGEPIAYIIGSAGFYGREFVVNEHVLIPRAETEHLIDEALAFVRGPMRVLDVGTGSGAIACTIAAETDAIVDGSDCSDKALRVAGENALRLGLRDRIQLHHGDLIAPVANNSYDLVIANLPYIPTPDLPKRPNPASFEPPMSLDGGPDGLKYYRRLLPELPALLNDSAMILLECAPRTFGPLQNLARQHLPNFVIEGGKDYARLPRYVKAMSGVVTGLSSDGAASESARSRQGEKAENRAQGRR
jgi:release factor glutamine methyltransferase